jgi:hypothetical protein
VYLYRAINQFGQIIDVLVGEKRDLAATRQFFACALDHGACPAEVSTDRDPTYPRVLNELLPSACHVMERYANNLLEVDHGRLKTRLRPMRGLKRLRSARVICAGRAFVQNLRLSHYDLATTSTRGIGSPRLPQNSSSPSERKPTTIKTAHPQLTQQRLFDTFGAGRRSRRRSHPSLLGRGVPSGFRATRSLLGHDDAVFGGWGGECPALSLSICIEGRQHVRP